MSKTARKRRAWLPAFGGSHDVSGNDAAETLRELAFKSFLLDSSTDAVIVRTLDGMTVYANESACELIGCTREEFLALPAFGWMPPDQRPAAHGVSARLERDREVVAESAILTADSRIVPVEVRSRLVVTEDGRFVISSARDISDRKQAEETIRRLAFYDALTGVANRTLFEDRLRVATSHAARSGESLAVMFLDIDHFKNVNDLLGHAAGDELLRAIADRLRGEVREGDTVARLGGDEFTLLFPNVAGETDAHAIAEKLLACLHDLFEIQGQELAVTGSVGVAMWHGPEDSVERLLRHADAAMYRAKDGGRNGFQFFDPSMTEESRDRFALKNDLRHALEREEFVARYQPIVRLSDGAIVGAELLARWVHPARGMLLPASFIGPAEESGDIVRIGEWGLCEGCRQAAEWREAGFTSMRIAVNLSARQFTHPRLLESVERALEESNLPPDRLELEITESTAMRDSVQMVWTCERLRELGVRLAIDDFGTGYSSLGHLERFPLHTLKVDRTFVIDVTDRSDHAAIAATIITLGHNLGLNVVSEGVETEEQLAFMRARGCDEVQGWLVSRPVAAEEFALLLDAQRRREMAGKELRLPLAG